MGMVTFKLQKLKRNKAMIAENIEPQENEVIETPEVATEIDEVIEPQENEDSEVIIEEPKPTTRRGRRA